MAEGLPSTLSSYRHRQATNRLPAELLILTRFGIEYSHINAAWIEAKQNKSDPVTNLIAANLLTESLWHEAQAMLARERGNSYLTQKHKKHLLTQAINNLNENLPQYSARYTILLSQIGRYSLYIGAYLALLYFYPMLAVVITFLAITGFYMAVIALRLSILSNFKKPQTSHPALLDGHHSKECDLPIYSVLVALYHEKAQVRDLTRHLYQMDWPKNKLDIKLICEEDDHETIAEILNCKLPQCFQLITVPPAQPRTKPKALNFALPLTKGEFVVLYDAEDRPAPTQFKEAYAKFLQNGPYLTCLQAPLQIHNQNQNWLTSMFAIEYLTLFNGILPALARWKLPMPLGGTSNHFRTRALKNVGGWDPYNVTEDADLGIRIYREGFYTSTINSPTYEEAPPRLGVWIGQRTRWVKGWMQTLLVHSRNPVLFVKEMGTRKTIAYHLILTSVVMSILLHPVLLALFIWKFSELSGGPFATSDAILMATSAFNLVGGYSTYGLLAYIVLKSMRQIKLMPFILTFPLYWLLISYAGWLAVIQLMIKPHYWEKTPHGLADSNFQITKS